MSTRKTYICNVCRDEYQSDKAADNLIGFEFRGKEIKQQLVGVMNVENHVCRRCLVGLVNLAALVFPAGDGER